MNDRLTLNQFSLFGKAGHWRKIRNCIENFGKIEESIHNSKIGLQGTYQVYSGSSRFEDFPEVIVPWIVEIYTSPALEDIFNYDPKRELILDSDTKTRYDISIASPNIKYMDSLIKNLENIVSD